MTAMFRADIHHLGVKDSGLGREGVVAIEEMSFLKTVILDTGI